MPTGSATECADNASEALGQVQFATLLARPGVQPCYQPIVHLHEGTHIGYEILSRSQFVGLETPEKMFRVAAQRMSEAELSRVCRLEGLRGATDIDRRYQLYLNTHPAELGRPELLESVQTLRNLYPAQEIVLEVHESGVTSIEFLRELRAILTDLNIGLAYDDFGAGQARLMELIEVPPDVLKFDVRLVQGLPTASAARRSAIASLIRIVQDPKVIPLAEGVETEEEAQICRELGFELAQRFLFGRGEPAKRWMQSKTGHHRRLAHCSDILRGNV
ncbi:MAG: EAL domain-containing protein [Planctomycetaceae bacterium]